MYSDFQKFPPKKHKRSKPRRSAGRSASQVLSPGRSVLPPREIAPEPKTGKRAAQNRRAADGERRKATDRKTPDHKRKPAAGKAGNRRPASFRKHRLRKVRWSRLFFVALLASALGYGVYWLTGPGWGLLLAKFRGDIRQAAGVTAPLPYTAKAYAILDRRIAVYLAKQPGHYSLAGRDLATGASFGIRQNSSFSAAQTIALPVVIDLYSQIANGSLKPTAPVALTAQDVTPGPGFIGGMPTGSRFTVSELAKAALIDADATAFNMLVRLLGKSQVDSFAAAMGGGPSALAQPYRITPLELTRYLAYLYTMFHAHSQAVAPLMRDLAAVPSEGRLAAGFPKGTQIAHIAGDWPHEFHDAALVWTIGHPLALAVCSLGVTQTAAAGVESHIARMVAQFEVTGY